MNRYQTEIGVIEVWLYLFSHKCYFYQFVFSQSPKPPEFIFWYQNDRMINYGSQREVSVHTEPGRKTQSRLTIRNARTSDSGNYSCKIPNGEPASISVYVLQGKLYKTEFVCNPNLYPVRWCVHLVLDYCRVFFCGIWSKPRYFP